MLSYRRDVDGLRAIAILLVVLFHADWGFQGGFIGVDVFFVISGYLITGKILQDLARGQFSFREFWLRRVRRIVPAATVTVFSTLVFGFALFLPADLISLSRSAVYQQLMIANAFFWRWTGYFDGSAELKPLLHMWSLAVEEQFYLVFPVLLAFAFFRLKSAVLPLICTVCLASLVMSQWLLKEHGSFSFYMLPTRAWEFLLGSLIWWLPSPAILKFGWARGIFVAHCFLGVLSTGWFYRDYFPFPGVYALLPCVSTMLLIWGNDDSDTAIGYLLKSTVMVGLGRLSYSWYLTHWPVLAFARYLYGLDLSVTITTVAVGLGIVGAILLFYCIEEPFRRGRFRQLTGKQLMGTLVSFAVFVVVFDAVTVASSGAMFRYSERFQQIIAEQRGAVLENYDESLFNANSGMLTSIGVKDQLGAEDKIDFMVWGDSHGTMLAETLDSLAKERGLSGLLASKSGVGPFPGSSRELGKDWNSKVYDVAVGRNIQRVLLVGKWNGALLSNSFNERAALTFLVSSLRDGGVDVSVMMQVPQQKLDPRSAWIRSGATIKEFPPGLSLAEYRRGFQPLAGYFDSLAKLGAKIISVEDNCFDSVGRSRLGTPDACYYWDDDHLSTLGVDSLLSPVLAKWMDQN